MQIVECVPNFSEGRDKTIIDAIASEIKSTNGVVLLDVDMGADTNRTVVTFIGEPKNVKEAAFKAIKKASELIDMTKHKGEHPRMGATDVCPFIPVSNFTMEECVTLAKELGNDVADKLKIPVFLYEEAAVCEERKNLANIRCGEYEGLPAKLSDPNWCPDCGEPVFNAKTGATVIGARKFLIAYNINLNTKDAKLANEIAMNIREAGRAKRGSDGKIVKDENGKTVNEPGRLKATKAVGWYIEEYKMAQISINLVDFNITPPHVAFDTACEEAEKLGLRVTGSELVGLIPKEALLIAGVHYLLKQGKSTGVPEEELIHTAVQSLGLNQISPFDPQKKIIEYQFKPTTGELRFLKIRDFANELSTDSPAPGGGSVAALSGALGAALAGMVSNLTIGKKGYEEVKYEMINIGKKAQTLKDELLLIIDMDTDAFNEVMAAMKMKKKTEDQKIARDKAVLEATIKATQIPLEVLRKSIQVFRLSKDVAIKGNQNSVSDAAVASLMAYSAAKGAYYNVLINLPAISDKEFVDRTLSEAECLIASAGEMNMEIEKMVEEKLKVLLPA